LNLTHPLVAAVLRAHADAALNNRPVSSTVFADAAKGSGDFGKACIAALATLGGEHAPITEARRLLYSPRRAVAEMLENSERIPGWGNAFYRYRRDPAWDDVANIMQQEHPQHAIRIDTITEELRLCGKHLFPNAAAYTAAAAHITGMPWGSETALLLAGRLPAWVEIWSQRA
jgi:citrate synthase